MSYVSYQKSDQRAPQEYTQEPSGQGDQYGEPR